MASALHKVPTGIAGFDDMTGGGIPAGRTTLVTGGPGTGKTIFALQTLVCGAAGGEPGIFVVFEESKAGVLENAASFRWDFEGARNKLFWYDAQITSDMVLAGEFDLQGLLASLSAMVDEVGAKRIAFDSIDVLLSLLGSPGLAQREVRRLQEWLSAKGLTVVLTAKAHSQTLDLLEPFGFLEFMTDCVVGLEHVVSAGVSHRSMRVLKYRGSSFQENASPMVIAPDGLEVASPLSRTLDPKLVFEERISSGIAALDQMFAGGFHRGSSILVTGAPGTAKSTLSGAFVQSACARGEASLFVSFDSDPQEIVRNMASVGIDLHSCRESGLLQMYSSRANASSAEVHLLNIIGRAREHGARCIVIDPISALSKSDTEVAGLGVTERLIDWAKHRGATVLCTSLLGAAAAADVESTPMHVSTIADTWIHLSYVIHAGERNRALTIVKSRGTAHSNQVRELKLSDNGVSLAEVYTAEGQVLMGTMRWQKERADRLAQERKQADLKLRERLLHGERDALQARLGALQQEVGAKDAELDLVRLAQAGQVESEETRRTQMLELRGTPRAAEGRKE
ncbi:circadian clock protein KaiC [Ramlibacter sp. AN1015]|uniref:circadian clock protein KaiC n=1 Tax=Ramlibacter sp. AN1015 TaxID=3133428 RepID=UPI0030BDA605